jgi:hypothetical protein
MDMGGQSTPIVRQKIAELVVDHAAQNPSVRAILIALIQTSRPLRLLLDAFKAAFGRGPLPCPVFCWIGAGHIATAQLPLDDAYAELEALGIRTFFDLDEALQATAGATR